MTKLNDILDVDLLQKHIDERLVGVQLHPTLPLAIYNYTQRAAFGGVWGDGTIDYCRGLIVDRESNIIARPFKKFHNLDTAGIPETNAENIAVHFRDFPPNITEKMDGSMGILWRFENEWGIATRGSFTSDQAKWATKWYSEKIISGEMELFNTSEFTPIFEIVYPDNRIVVKYDFEGLILLALVNKHLGYEQAQGIVELLGSYRGFKDNYIVKNYGRQDGDFRKKNPLPDSEKNREGYVLTFDNGVNEPPLKVKIKFDEYCTLHKVVTGLSPKGIWELLSQGNKDFIKGTPEHFVKWAQQWIDKLESKRIELIMDAFEIFDRKPNGSRKEVAEYFKLETDKRAKEHLLGILFMLYDERPVVQRDEAIWKLVKPRGDDKSFRQDGE